MVGQVIVLPSIWGSPFVVSLFVVRLFYFYPESLLSVLDAGLQCGFVPEDMFGPEPGCFNTSLGPVLSSLVSFGVSIFPLFLFVRGVVFVALSPEVDSFVIDYDGVLLVFLV